VPNDHSDALKQKKYTNDDHHQRRKKTSPPHIQRLLRLRHNQSDEFISASSARGENGDLSAGSNFTFPITTTLPNKNHREGHEFHSCQFKVEKDARLSAAEVRF
jgi:hypothetical protein